MRLLVFGNAEKHPMDMSQTEFGERLRIFRFYGQKERWEDNVTRALLCVVVRSLSGPTFLRELLEAFAKHGKQIDGPPGVCCELLSRLPSAKLISVETQEAFRPDETRPKPEFALLVELIPGERVPDAAATPTPPASEAGRVDGVLRFQSDDETEFVVVIESKLIGQETSEKLQKYARWLGAARCASITSKWNDVVGVIGRLAELNQREPLIEDFVDYLESFPGLLGFRGFKGKFSKDARHARLHELRLLARSLIGQNCDFAQCVSQRCDPGDLDLYTWDQFALIGDVGVASWDGQPLCVKLVVGMNSYPQRMLPEHLLEVQRRSGRGDQFGETFRGARLLLAADPTAVAAAFEKLDRSVAGLSFHVGFRLRFNRWDDRWINSTALPFNDASSWQHIAEVLRLAECQGEISNQTLDKIQPFVDDVGRDMIGAARDDLRTPRSRAPTHHGALVVTAPIDTGKLIACGISLEQTRQVVLATLRPVSEALREISNLSVGAVPCC